MNKLSTLFSIIALPLLISGCAIGTVKIPPPVADNSAGVLIKIPSTCLPLSPCANQTLTFARLKADGSLLSDELYQTSVVRSDHYYLLNVKPGRYVAVAASYSRSMNTNTNTGGGLSVTSNRVFAENILFSEKLVKQSEVEVTANTLAVMGEFDFDIQGRMGFAPSAAKFLEDADAVQAHYARQMVPELESHGMTSSVKFYRAQFESANKDAASRKRLLDTAATHIGPDGWDQQVMHSK